MDDAFQRELDRRLNLMESDPGSGMIQPTLPVRDVLIAVVGVVTMTLLMLWWAY